MADASANAMGPSVGIGNYKGVMLCNRPFAGTAAAAQGKTVGGAYGASESGAKPAFSIGTVSTGIGSNIPIANKAKPVAQVNRSKKNTALSKHKRWLAELQKTKDQLAMDYLEDQNKKEELRQRFMEREARIRAVVCGTAGDARDQDRYLDDAKSASYNDDMGGSDSPDFYSNNSEDKGYDTAMGESKFSGGGNYDGEYSDYKNTELKLSGGSPSIDSRSHSSSNLLRHSGRAGSGAEDKFGGEGSMSTNMFESRSAGGEGYSLGVGVGGASVDKDKLKSKASEFKRSLEQEVERREAAYERSAAEIADDNMDRLGCGIGKPKAKVNISNSKKAPPKGKPPPWALTAAAAKEAEDVRMREEEADLLAFAEGLDFEKYIDELEVDTMISAVETTIGEIEREELLLRDREEKEHQRAIAKEGAASGGAGGSVGFAGAGAGAGGGRVGQLSKEVSQYKEILNKLKAVKQRKDARMLGEGGVGSGSGSGEGGGEEEEESILRMARDLLHSRTGGVDDGSGNGDRDIRSVHSTKSLAAVAQRQRDRLMSGGRVDDASVNEPALLDPRIVSHQDDGGLRRGGKYTVSNLPYMNRNPAV